MTTTATVSGFAWLPSLGTDLDEPGLFEQVGQTWTSQTTSTIVLPGLVEQGRPAVSVLDVLRARVV